MLLAIVQQAHLFPEVIEMDCVIDQGQQNAHHWINEGTPAELISVDHSVVGACQIEQSWMPVAQDSQGVYGHLMNELKPIRVKLCFVLAPWWQYYQKERREIIIWK